MVRGADRCADPYRFGPPRLPRCAPHVIHPPHQAARARLAPFWQKKGCSSRQPQSQNAPRALRSHPRQQNPAPCLVLPIPRRGRPQRTTSCHVRRQQAVTRSCRIKDPGAESERRLVLAAASRNCRRPGGPVSIGSPRCSATRGTLSLPSHHGARRSADRECQSTPPPYKQGPAARRRNP